MSGEDLRKIMNLMESSDSNCEEAETDNDKVDESVELDEADDSESLEAKLWKIYNFGRNNNDEWATAYVNEIMDMFDEAKGDVTEEAILETGNANAQQKGINFNGTPSNKNKGDMDQSSPKSKGPGSKSALAQAIAGTKVGQIKS